MASLDMNPSWIPVVIVGLLLVTILEQLVGFGYLFYCLLKRSSARKIDAEATMIATEGFPLQP